MAAASAVERYPVRSYEVDGEGRLTVVALCNYLQESAGLHARALGVSVDQLLKQGMTWFLWRLHLAIDRLPSWGETVEVETWPAELGKPFAIRDFRIRSAGGRTGVATTAWLLVDAAAKRPIRRLPERIRDVLVSRCDGSADAGGALLHGLTREADGQEVARARSRWR